MVPGLKNNQKVKAEEEIFTRTYGPIKREKSGWKKSRRVDYSESRELTAPAKKQEVRDEYLLVDGYNIIFSWEELNELAKVNVESAHTERVSRQWSI